MSLNDDNASRTHRLRSAAEAQLARSAASRDASAPVPERLLHELQVHQIELEMQNETLRQAQVDLQNSRDRYHHLYESAPVGYLTLTADGLVTESNRAGVALLHTDGATLPGKPFISFVVPECQDHWVKHFMRVNRGAAGATLEINLRRDDGSELPVQIECTCRDDDVSGVRIMLSDISLRRQAQARQDQYRLQLEERVASRTAELVTALEAAEAASRAKSIFLANMTHELRTPLNAIIGMTDLALQQASAPAQIDWLTKSKGAAQHLLAIISNVLDISTIESNRMILVERTFTLADAIDECIGMQAEAARAKGLLLSREIAANLPMHLHGDVTRMKQVLINYIGNAIKFSGHGEIRLRAKAVEEDCDNLLLHIEVSDQGIGISQAQQALLFQPFVQADESVTRNYGGTGLGLAIARRIARLMDGEAGVISEAGQGSTFWATFRLRRVVGAIQSAGMAAELIARDFTGARVLVVEDNLLNQELDLLLLRKVGLRVDIAANGEEAVEKVRQATYALILMDMQMPVMDGLTATRAIRKLSGGATVPILAMTGNSHTEERERCLDAGMNDHVGKPIEPGLLYATLLHWLQKKTV